MTPAPVDAFGFTAAELVAAAPPVVRRLTEAVAYLDGSADYRLSDVVRHGNPNVVRDRLERAWATLGALERAGLTVTPTDPTSR